MCVYSGSTRVCTLRVPGDIFWGYPGIDSPSIWVYTLRVTGYTICEHPGIYSGGTRVCTLGMRGYLLDFDLNNQDWYPGTPQYTYASLLNTTLDIDELPSLRYLGKRRIPLPQILSQLKLTSKWAVNEDAYYDTAPVWLNLFVVHTHYSSVKTHVLKRSQPHTPKRSPARSLRS